MMALPQIVSRNQTQKIPTFEINGRVVLQPNTWYTCPTGKKAIIKGVASCTGLGAAATTTLLAAAVTIRAYTATGATDPWQRTLLIGTVFSFEVQLAAGEILQTTQNAGTNSEWDIFATVQESSV